MTREEARNAAEVMLAYADEKEIEYKTLRSPNEEWEEEPTPAFNWTLNDYRIKPLPKCRPFNSLEECWEEMQHHQPFGWVKDKKKGCYFNICCVSKKVEIYPSGICAFSCSFKDMMHDYTFINGTPFGKRVE